MSSDGIIRSDFFSNLWSQSSNVTFSLSVIIDHHLIQSLYSLFRSCLCQVWTYINSHVSRAVRVIVKNISIKLDLMFYCVSVYFTSNLSESQLLTNDYAQTAAHLWGGGWLGDRDLILTMSDREQWLDDITCSGTERVELWMSLPFCW